MRGILGADVFVNLLLVFIITTGLLLMNTNKNGPDHPDKASELQLPGIKLPKGSSGELSTGSKSRQLTLSAKNEGSVIRYFIDNAPVEYKDLPLKLKTGEAGSVKVRFDRGISYGHYVEILEICKQAGIKEIINVYEKIAASQEKGG